MDVIAACVTIVCQITLLMIVYLYILELNNKFRFLTISFVICRENIEAWMLLNVHSLTVFIHVDSIRVTTQFGGCGSAIWLSNLQSYVCNSA